MQPSPSKYAARIRRMQRIPGSLIGNATMAYALFMMAIGAPALQVLAADPVPDPEPADFASVDVDQTPLEELCNVDLPGGGGVSLMRAIEFSKITVGEEDRYEMEQAPDTDGRDAANLDVVIFRPDSPELPSVLCFSRNGDPVAAFADDGSDALSAKELERMQYVLVKSHEDSLRYTMVLDGKRMGVDAILNLMSGKDNEARLTLVKAASNDEIILAGTLFSPPSSGSSGLENGKSVVVGIVIAFYAVVRIWCINRCDRCTDTCNNNNCDENACHDCFDTPACDV